MRLMKMAVGIVFGTSRIREIILALKRIRYKHIYTGMLTNCIMVTSPLISLSDISMIIAVVFAPLIWR